MQKLAILILAVAVAAGAQAQKKAAAPQKQSVEELLEAYKFEEASTLINKELQTARKKKLDTGELEAQLAVANNGTNMLSSTEDVVFIDSIVVDKQKILNVYRIDSEAGKIGYLSTLINSGKKSTNSIEEIAYMPQLLDKIFYSSAKDSSTYLFTRDKIDDQWSAAKQLSGLEDFGSAQATPYMLTDGSTLYFAAKGEESLGGYDIYMSRYSQDQGEFLKPENIGMPFNSPANDYLYVIDEANNLGWFATDRRQPEGKVCVYVFIPNKTRKAYDPDAENLESFAMLNSIKATQPGHDSDVKAALARLKNVYSEKASAGKASDFTFVVNDSKTYTSLGDFKNAEAKKYAAQWQEAVKMLSAQKAQLDKERDAYAVADKNGKNSLASKILSEEQNLQKLSQNIEKLEKIIRQKELAK